MAMKSLESMSSQELRIFIDSFDTVLCDVYGTLWNDEGPFKGVSDTMANFKKCGKNIFLVVNGSLLGVDIIHDYTKDLKFEIDRKNIVVPVLAMIEYLHKINFTKEIYVLGSKIVKQMFKDAGYTVSNVEKEKLIDSFSDLVDNLKDNVKIGAVVFDFDMNLSYINILKSIVYLTRPDVLYLIGTNEKRLPGNSPGTTIEGQQRFQNLITEITGKTPIKFSKPSPYLNEYIKNTHAIDKSKTLVVGDSLQDMEFASKCGYKKLLVLTGTTTYDNALDATDKKIDYYVKSFGDVSKIIKGKLNIFHETVDYVGGAIAALNLHF